MHHKILFCLLISLAINLTNAYACDCVDAPEATRSIDDLAKTAADEDRYVVAVKIIATETRLRETNNTSYEVEGFIAQVVEILAGCIEYNEIFIREAGGCSDYDVYGLKIGDTGLAMGSREQEDFLSAFQCDTRHSYYKTKNDKTDSSNSSIGQSISLDDLRKYDSCSLDYEIFPNPTSQSIQVTLDKEPIQANLPVTVLDESGRVVLKAVGPMIIVAQLSAGTYFIRVGNNESVNPLVIAH